MTEKAIYYRHLLQACGQSVLFVAGAFALFGVLKGGLVGGVSLLVVGIILGAFPMGIAALLFLPLVFYRPVPPHPAVFSLAGIAIFSAAGGVFLSCADLLNGSEGSTSVAVQVMLFGAFYAGPIGFFLRHNLARAEKHHHAANAA